MSRPPAGTCFGYDVRSTFELDYLRDGGGDSPLAIEPIGVGDEGPAGSLLHDWPASGDQFGARLYGAGSQYRLWITDAGWFSIDAAAGRIGAPAETDATRREERLWGLPALLCFHARGDLPLHAAAIEVDGGAILLAAPRTFGKSTLAAGFARAGFRPLADDLACLRLDGTGAIVPGPAMLRLRPDVADRLELACGSEIGRGGGRIHVALDARLRGDCRPVPISAVVVLAEGEQLELEQVPAALALRELWAVSFRLPTEHDRVRCFDQLTRLVDGVPVLRLVRPLVLDELDRTVERIVAGV